MGGFGDLFGGLGDLLGGLAEFGGERAAEAVAESSFDGRRRSGENDATASVERYLTGAKRALNINDI